jgi:hypothetical protein
MKFGVYNVRNVYFLRVLVEHCYKPRRHFVLILNRGAHRAGKVFAGGRIYRLSEVLLPRVVIPNGCEVSLLELRPMASPTRSIVS